MSMAHGQYDLCDVLNTSEVPNLQPTVTIREQDRVVCVCVAPGVLLRQSSTGMWVDSAWCGDESFLQEMKYTNSSFHLVPFMTHDRPPRSLLGCHQLTQAICHPRLEGGSIMVPATSQLPLVTTPYGRICEREYVPPGTNCVIVYANFNETFEDAIMVSKAAADRGMMARTVITTVPIPVTDPVPGVGSRVSMSTHSWWKVRSSGTVTKAHCPGMRACAT